MSSSSSSEDLEDLGYANGWVETPLIVQNCEELEHVKQYRNLGGCQHAYWCDICMYRYKVDSSD